MQMVHLDEEEGDDVSSSSSSPRWSNLLPELLYTITTKLLAPDLAMFRSVCKSWRSITDGSIINRSPALLNSTNFFLNSLSSQYPILITVHRKYCSFFHPLLNATYKKVIPQLIHARLYYCKANWLLLTRHDNTSVFFFNLSTMITIHLPPLPTPQFHTMTFTSTPDSTDWSIIAMSLSKCSVIKHGESNWKISDLYGPPFDLFDFYCAPIVSGGLCYNLGAIGKVVTFSVNTIQEEDSVETELISEAPLKERGGPNDWYFFERFMVQVDEHEMLVIFLHNIKCVNPVPHIYRLDMLKRTWGKVDSLGNKMLFISYKGCLLVEAPSLLAANKVYYPDFQNNSGVFYSLATAQTHSFLAPITHHQRVSMPLNCGWIYAPTN